MNEEQIKHMVSRFLGWKLPDDFNPDAGISFKPDYNEHTEYPAKHEPVGTNLFSATQAEEMIRHMLSELPTPDLDVRSEIEQILEELGVKDWSMGWDKDKPVEINPRQQATQSLETLMDRVRIDELKLVAAEGMKTNHCDSSEYQFQKTWLYDRIAQLKASNEHKEEKK